MLFQNNFMFECNFLSRRNTRRMGNWNWTRRRTKRTSRRHTRDTYWTWKLLWLLADLCLHVWVLSVCMCACVNSKGNYLRPQGDTFLAVKITGIGFVYPKCAEREEELIKCVFSTAMPKYISPWVLSRSFVSASLSNRAKAFCSWAHCVCCKRWHCMVTSISTFFSCWCLALEGSLTCGWG